MVFMAWDKSQHASLAAEEEVSLLALASVTARTMSRVSASSTFSIATKVAVKLVPFAIIRSMRIPRFIMRV
jgi:hypothetical protein